MDDHDPQMLFGGSEDTGDVVLLPGFAGAQERDPAWAMWRAAHAQAGEAWRHWRDVGGTCAFVGYQAALDREQAAQRMLELGAPAREAVSADGPAGDPDVRRARRT